MASERLSWVGRGLTWAMVMGGVLAIGGACGFLQGGPERGSGPATAAPLPTRPSSSGPVASPSPTRTPLPLPSTPVGTFQPARPPTATPTPPGPTPTPSPTALPTATATATATPFPVLTNSDAEALTTDPAAFVGYQVRMVVVKTAGPLLSQCFRCPAPDRSAGSFPVMQPRLAPALEAFLFSYLRMIPPAEGLLLQVSGTVHPPVEAETVFGVRKLVPTIEIDTLQVIFADETWHLMGANLDRFVILYGEAPVVIQGLVAGVERTPTFTLVKLRTSGLGILEPDTLVSIPPVTSLLHLLPEGPVIGCIEG